MKLKAGTLGVDISRQTALWLMLVILLICFGLSLPTLNRHQISTDELATLTKIGGIAPAVSPAEIVALVQTHTPDQVPLYYVLVWIWAQFTGFTVFPLRLLSTLTGLLALAAVFRFAADTCDRRVALLSALLFSFSSLAVTRFHIIRMLPLVMLLAAIHTWLYWRLAHGKGGRGRDWLAFVLSIGCLLYTHILAPVIIAGLGAYHLAFVPRNARWRRILAAWALGTALILPYLTEIARGAEVVAVRERHPPMPLLEIVSVLGGALTNFAPMLWLPILVGIGMAFYRRRAGGLARIGFVALAAALALVLLNGFINLLEPKSMRYFLPIWHLAIIIFAAALLQLPWRRLTVPLFVALWAASGFNLLYGEPDPSYEYAYRVYSDFREKYPPLHRYAQILRGKTLPGEYLIGFRTSHYVYFDHPHVGGSFAQYYLETEIELGGVFLHATEGKYRLKRDVEAVMAARPYVILAHDPRDELPNRELALHHIEQAFHACPAFVDEADLHIQRYAHPVVGCDHAPAASVVYGNGIRLRDRAVRYDVESESVQALLWWGIPDEAMLDDFNISLQVFDSNGEKAEQVDRHLDAQLTPWGVVELATGDLAAGEYELKLILYNRHDGAKVSSANAAKLITIFGFVKAAA